MPSFGAESTKQRATLHGSLQRLCDEVIKVVDFSIIEGFRGEALQTRDYLTGKSKLPWPLGKHNQTPAEALDFSPYPADWKDAELPHARFAFIAGVFFAVADVLGIKIRWGADWNRNFDPRDESFLDWGHIELA